MVSRPSLKWGAVVLGAGMALGGGGCSTAQQKTAVQSDEETAVAAAKSCFVIQSFFYQSQQKVLTDGSGVYPSVTPCHKETDVDTGIDTLAVAFDYQTVLRDHPGREGELDAMKAALCIRAIEISASFLGEEAVELDRETPVLCAWRDDPTTAMEVTIPTQRRPVSGAYRPQ